ncbi:uncharacterized protein N7479_008377 [Penicillium vulpinum]|uniref:Uncharacterized protein n=1 Tax=Penicillium vulpinum TaxID=29845 RepID=A0A1V6RFH0_9EURO|nr:uncharacterized protein N7479_008377 [Penicillium vulpinum]KAJ5961227.1 hypothetical protein N7479_008377 [Penicillium vulpinum]OQE00163.1 hypothetical protein PENVUL_c057G08369 [Penicillium vulpinum]
MESPTYGLAISIYSRGDAKLGDGPSHMGIAIYKYGASTCEIHHIRNPTDEDFIYDPRTQPLEDPVLKGRCELASLNYEQMQQVASLISAFGKDESNHPEFGVGNCQDWVAGAVGMLEHASYVSPGEGAFWKSMINRSSEEMKNECLQGQRKWIDGPESTYEGEPDARFVDRERDTVKPVGKLAQNEVFRARIQSLLGPKGSGRSDDKTPVERPFYVSSPFFSKMNERNN